MKALSMFPLSDRDEELDREIRDRAIIELVNQKIEERYNSMSEEDKQIYRESYNQIKAKLQESKSNLEEGK